MEVTVYHNPRCSKSRRAVALIEQRGIRPRIVKYLETPPSRDELVHLLKMLGVGPRALLRVNEEEYKSAGLHNMSLSDAQLIDAMVTTPKLMQRPIVVVGQRAVVGRPPEKVLELL